MANGLVVSPAGMLLPYVSARRRHEILDTAFEMLGGTDRLVHEANRNSDGYWQFMRLWGKGLPRVAQHELTAGAGIDDLMDRVEEIERERSAKVIDGNAKVLDGAP